MRSEPPALAGGDSVSPLPRCPLTREARSFPHRYGAFEKKPHFSEMFRPLRAFYFGGRG